MLEKYATKKPILILSIHTVIMDILGVVLAVTVSRAILDGPMGLFIMTKIGMVDALI